MAQKISVQDTVDLLNELIELDRQAIWNLISHRVKCSDSFKDHPSVQIGLDTDTWEYDLEIIGLLNGLFPNDIQLGRIGLQCEIGNEINTMKFLVMKFPNIRKREGIYTHPDHYEFREFAMSGGRNRKLKELDITGDTEKGFCWGYMTDFGNPVSDEMWWEMKFVREFTENDRKSMGAFTELAFEIDD